MNRVLVIGLLPDQQRIFEREFPRLDLRFAGEGVTGVNPVAARMADRVFLMTRFAQHAQQDRVPRSKLKLVQGGMDSLRDALQAYTATIPLEEERIGYVAPIIEDDMAKDLKFRGVRQLRPGQSVALERPNHVKREVFKARVMNSVSRYKAEGIELRSDYDALGDLVELVCLRNTTLPVVTEAEARELGGIRGDDVLVGNEEALHAAPPPIGSVFDEVAAASEDTAPEPRRFVGKHPALGMGFAMASTEALIWERVLLESMRLSPGAPMRHHTDNADAAASAYRRRFHAD